jgi:hypothetical protein
LVKINNIPVNRLKLKVHSPRIRSDIYKYGILLVLLLEGQSCRQIQLQSRLEHVVGRVRKETFFLNIHRLKSKGWIVKKQVDVIPKRTPRRRKPRRHREIYPLATELMTDEDGRGQNHKNGRYEVYLAINQRLPTNFIGKLKSEVASFFGFETWNNGLYCERRGLEATLLNIRNSFLRVRRDMAGEPSSRAEYKTEIASNSRIWGNEAAVGDDDSSELLKLESAFLPPPPQCMKRRRNRAWLPEQSTAGRIVMREQQGNGSFQDGSIPGKSLRPGKPDRTF